MDFAADRTVVDVELAQLGAADRAFRNDGTLMAALLDLRVRASPAGAVVERLRWLLETSPLEPRTGTYFGWLVRQALVEALERHRMDGLDAVLEVLGRPQRMPECESTLARVLDRADLRARRSSALRPDVGRVPVDGVAREVLRDALGMLATSSRPFRLRIEDVIDVLADACEDHPSIVGPLEEALVTAGESPVGALRIGWLAWSLALRCPLPHVRLAELADRDAHTTDPIVSVSLPGTYLRRQPSGFACEPEIAWFAARLRNAVAILPTDAARRRALRDDALRSVWTTGSTVTLDRLLAGCRALGDAESLAIADDLTRGHVRLAVLEGREFDRHAPRPGWSAMYGPDLTLFGRSERTIVLRDHGPITSLASAFLAHAMLVHEWDHSIHFSTPADRRGVGDVVRQEWLASLRETAWCAEHGELRAKLAYAWRCPQGLGVFMRAEVEHFYVQKKNGVNA